MPIMSKRTKIVRKRNASKRPASRAVRPVAMAATHSPASAAHRYEWRLVMGQAGKSTRFDIYDRQVNKEAAKVTTRAAMSIADAKALFA